MSKLADQNEDRSAARDGEPELKGILAKHTKAFSPLPKHLPPSRSVDHEIVVEPSSRRLFTYLSHEPRSELERARSKLTRVY